MYFSDRALAMAIERNVPSSKIFIENQRFHLLGTI